MKTTYFCDHKFFKDDAHSFIFWGGQVRYLHMVET